MVAHTFFVRKANDFNSKGRTDFPAVKGFDASDGQDHRSKRPIKFSGIANGVEMRAPEYRRSFAFGLAPS